MAEDTIIQPTSLTGKAHARLAAKREELAARTEEDDLNLSPNATRAYLAETRQMTIEIGYLERDATRYRRAFDDLSAAASPHIATHFQWWRAMLGVMREHFVKQLGELPRYGTGPQQERIEQLVKAVDVIDGKQPLRRGADGRQVLPLAIDEALQTLKIAAWHGSQPEIDEQRAGAAERLRQAKLEYDAAERTLEMRLEEQHA